MDPLEQYIRELRDIRSSGAAVPETSYYPALASLLNEVGKSITPRVRCIMGLADTGAGLPDGGLFTPDQFPKSSQNQASDQIPSRGAIEVKSTADDAWITADGEQVTRYWKRYGQVLVTNLRDFVLVGRDSGGRPKKLESYSLAASDADFWAEAARPKEVADKHAERFTAYLTRVMLYSAPLAAPQDLARFLASYAREANARVQGVDLEALTAFRAALEDTLGVKFEGDKGDHFFRSTLIQTLFYGIFSAWVLWSRGRSSDERFHWRETSWWLHVPMIRSLFEQVATPAKLGPLDLVEVLDWTEDTLDRVDRDVFFKSFEEDRAVQYFYEPFLHAFDPALQKELGVWYTPQEVVRYMVKRVDALLIKSLGIKDGLADPRVVVLDPCAGTGSYVVEVLRQISSTLKRRHGDALVGSDIKTAAMERVFGFELLPAPFVVAHLQIGLLLESMGAPLSEEKAERAGIFLTNALTGWEPLDPEKEDAFQAILTGFPELLNERDLSREVKQDAPILVIIGNPPYNGFAGVSPTEERGLVDAYKAGLKEWGITKNYLDDLYVRFFRLGERRIAEQGGRGIVCYISNFSYLDDPSFVVMRQHLLSQFDEVWIDCMNGDSRQTGKLTPDGEPDPSVFSTEYNRQGIRVGTAISAMVRKGVQADRGSARIEFRNFWGRKKRSDLLASLSVKDFESQFENVEAVRESRYSFRPSDVVDGYYRWPRLVDLSSVNPLLGLNDNRKQATHSITRDEISSRMKAYFDPKRSIEEIRELAPGLATDAASFDAAKTRKRLLRESGFQEENVIRFWFKPFDLRWAYVERIGNLWNRVRPELLDQSWEGNEFLLARRHAPKFPDGAPVYFTGHVSDQHVMQTDAYFFPLRLRSRSLEGAHGQAALLQESSNTTANLSVAARSYLSELGIRDLDDDSGHAEALWMHALAIGYSSTYASDCVGGIRRDWPRIPLPSSKEQLLASAALGRMVADLLNIDRPIEGVTVGTIRSELAAIGVVGTTDNASLDPAAGDLAVKAGWGHAGMGDVIMPGGGVHKERDYTRDERSDLEVGFRKMGLSISDPTELLGRRTLDIYLNDKALWRNIPVKVWEFTIGGYQVIKKWLSYREYECLGRPLTPEETRQVGAMARRIAAILLLGGRLDANYLATRDNSIGWPIEGH